MSGMNEIAKHPRISDEVVATRRWFEAMILPDQKVTRRLVELALEQLRDLEGMAAAQDRETEILRAHMTEAAADAVIAAFTDEGSGVLQ